MPEQILNFENDPQMRSFTRLVKKINSSIQEEHGISVNLEPPKHTDATFKTKVWSRKSNSMKEVEVRLNSTVPSEELFSLAQTLVRPSDEPFSARNLFPVDNSYHEGSQTVGFDVVEEQGEAKLVAVGKTMGTVPASDASVGRTLQHVGKIMTSMQVTRDDIQQMDLRRDRGMGPLVALMEEKLRTSRKNLDRQEDYIVWVGGNIAGVQQGRINGVFDFFSADAALHSSNAPTRGKKAQVPVGAGGLRTWASKTPDEIIADISPGAAHLMRNGAFVPRAMAIPWEVLVSTLTLKRTADNDSTPLIEWIKRAFQSGFGVDLKIIGTNALKSGTVSGTTRGNTKADGPGFILLDNSIDNMAIASVEEPVLLPPKEDEEGTIKQVIQMKTGGFMPKHPNAMYNGYDIA